MSKKDNVIKSMISMMDMGAIEGEGSIWYNEAKEALEEVDARDIIEIKDKVIEKLTETLKTVIDCTDDYDIFDRLDGNQYFKHEIFKGEIEFLDSLTKSQPK